MRSCRLVRVISSAALRAPWPSARIGPICTTSRVRVSIGACQATHAIAVATGDVVQRRASGSVTEMRVASLRVAPSRVPSELRVWRGVSGIGRISVVGLRGICAGRVQRWRRRPATGVDARPADPPDRQAVVHLRDQIPYRAEGMPAA